MVWLIIRPQLPVAEDSSTVPSCHPHHKFAHHFSMCVQTRTVPSFDCATALTVTAKWVITDHRPTPHQDASQPHGGAVPDKQERDDPPGTRRDN